MRDASTAGDTYQVNRIEWPQPIPPNDVTPQYPMYFPQVPAMNGTEQRLDAILAELRTLRQAITPASVNIATEIDIKESPQPERQLGRRKGRRRR